MEKQELDERLKIIGTSHISRESVNAIRAAFDDFKPDFVLVELDKRRMQGLLQGGAASPTLGMARHVGIQGYLFMVIGGFLQKRLGKIVDMRPGADMLFAVKMASKEKKRIFLIDQDILITLRNFSKAFTWKERFQILKDIFSAPFSEKIRIDLRKVPGNEMIKQLMQELRKKYPSLYKVLVEDRNKHMANAAMHIAKQHPEKRLLLIVGAGHESGMRSILEKNNMMKRHNC